MDESRRQELGYERLSIRPIVGTKAQLADLAKAWGCTPTEALVRLVQVAHRSLER